MTKKDYELIAGALKEAKNLIMTKKYFDENEPFCYLRGLKMGIARLCMALEKENPHFNSRKFLKVCEY